MSNISRQKTRRLLYQALYARYISGASFDRDAFVRGFFDDESIALIDRSYLDEMYGGILEHDSDLSALVRRLAPKYDLDSMPGSNIIIMFIACYEMLYFSDRSIPETVSINEAVELAKKFSDNPARSLINAVLNRVKEQTETLRTETFPESPYRFFSMQ